MRIVAGRFRGRSLAVPAGRSTRPTSDRLRESLFNVLEHTHGDPCPGARVLDLFAGTGALGFEALSRGAAFALFVDDGAEARACLRDTIEALRIGGITRVFRRDAARLGPASGARFSLAFLDPPYGQDLAPAALAGLHRDGWLEPGALCVVEEAAQASVDLPPPFDTVERREQGDTALLFCRYGAPVTA